MFLALLPYGQQGRGWRSRWEAAWDVLNCCKWDGACCAQGFKSPSATRLALLGGSDHLGLAQGPHVPPACQGASGVLSVAGTRSPLHLLGRVGGMLQDHRPSLVALGYPGAPRQPPAPWQAQCIISLQAFLPENHPFSHFWEQNSQAVPGTFSPAPLSSPRRGWGLWVLLGAVRGAGRG